jgi:uncharacterized protein (TIGR02270 family)
MQGAGVAQTAVRRPVIEPVLAQHLDGVASLRVSRRYLVRSNAALRHLLRLDERLLAHLEGLVLAGEAGARLIDRGLDGAGVGTSFASAVCALEAGDTPRIERMLKLAAAEPVARRAVISAMGWVSPQLLKGLIAPMLAAEEPVLRVLALGACAMHRVDIGPALTQAVQDADAGVRARAWRVAGQLGRRDLADAARLAVSQQAASMPAVDDEHATVVLGAGGVPPNERADRRAAAWALTLWGLGQNELVRQALTAVPPGQAWPAQDAHRLATMAAPLDWGRDQVRALAAKAEASAPAKRRMMRMAAWVGDVQVVPWLIHHMADDNWARLAGEAFSLITGADLAALSLERKPPEGLAPGPNDDPEDRDVAMDEDDSLPWPDQAKVKDWWQGQAPRFAVGQRYFVGEPPSAGHAIRVLKTAGQRQRIMAAEYLCLLNPGSMMLPVAAPAWRQSRWLDAV